MPIIHDSYITRESSPRRNGRKHGFQESQGEDSTARLDGSSQRMGTKKSQGSDTNATYPAKSSADNVYKRWTGPTDRGGLIAKVKRGESPAWKNGLSTDGYLSKTEQPLQSIGMPPFASPSTPRGTLLPSPNLLPSIRRDGGPYDKKLPNGAKADQPKSALHAGDFREGALQRQSTPLPQHSQSLVRRSLVDASFATSPPAPWTITPLILTSDPFHDGRKAPLARSSIQELYRTRSRAISHAAIPPKFLLHPPTTPLVQQSNNTDLDFSLRGSSRQSSRSPERSSRRRTFSPRSFQTFHDSSSNALHGGGLGSQPLPKLRREDTAPAYQAHQPRRSLTSFQSLHSGSVLLSPLSRPRRPSISTEFSPLQHAPMVGSYEESILRGRMSTTPSKPLNFVARIGVLGKGQCKSSLRCPPHVTVPFPAVFYSYGYGNNRSTFEDGPSPYVGLIDIDNTLRGSTSLSESKLRHRPATLGGEPGSTPGSEQEGPPAISTTSTRLREKRKRRSNSPKAPPGGHYRIPQQGQLQIVILNPNKTAVKLFLVPYDLSGLEAGQKTFIRQRSYSAGPVIDMPISTRKNFGTDRPEAALSNSDDPRDRPVLRYLIHLHICCPSKGRFFLYKSIRVVFANRVPDGKEKLRNETQLPEPRYSPYRPNREAADNAPSPGAKLKEKYNERQSADLIPTLDGTRSPSALDVASGPSDRINWSSSSVRWTPDSALPAHPRPAYFFSLPQIDSRPASRGQEHSDDSSNGSRPPSASLWLSADAMGLGLGLGLGEPVAERNGYAKLRRGENGYGYGYGGVGGGGGGVEGVEGLIARRLRGFEGRREGEG